VTIDRVLTAIDRAVTTDGRLHDVGPVVVFGDYCLDAYLHIDATRDEPSLETGLTAYQVHGNSLHAGAAGTVVNNLRSLGVPVRCVGVVGDDGNGFELARELDRTGADTGLMVHRADVATNAYIKPMRRDNAEAVYVEANRLDIKNFFPAPRELEDQLIANLESALPGAACVVVCEQYPENQCSAVTARIRSTLADLAGRNPNRFYYVDSRGSAERYRGVIVKCNQFELPLHDGDETVADRARRLLAVNGRAVVVTLGPDGACVVEPDATTYVPAFHVDGPIDIVGAGDATNAGIALGLTLGLSLPDATLLGACVSSITIQQLGTTGTATLGQVRARLAANATLAAPSRAAS